MKNVNEGNIFCKYGSATEDVESLLAQLNQFKNFVSSLVSTSLANSVIQPAQDVIDLDFHYVHQGTFSDEEDEAFNSQAQLKSDLPSLDRQIHHGVSAYGREALPVGVQPSTNAQSQQSIITQVTQHMQIPLSYADAVIGTAGANISYIRRASGATITIQETRGIPGEMTVEINGSASQVQTAQQLIQISLGRRKDMEVGQWG